MSSLHWMNPFTPWNWISSHKIFSKPFFLKNPTSTVSVFICSTSRYVKSLFSQLKHSVLRKFHNWRKNIRPMAQSQRKKVPLFRCVICQLPKKGTKKCWSESRKSRKTLSKSKPWFQDKTPKTSQDELLQCCSELQCYSIQQTAKIPFSPWV